NGKSAENPSGGSCTASASAGNCTIYRRPSHRWNRFHDPLSRRHLGPGDLDPLVLYLSLELRQQRLVVAHATWRFLLAQAKRDEQSDRFADVPFHRMQAIAAVRDVRDAQVFAG